MNKGLEALERISNHIEVCFDYSSDEDLSIIEKDLKILEIIMNKQVHIARINKCDNVLQYNMGTMSEERYLTEEEFNLIKEQL